MTLTGTLRLLDLEGGTWLLLADDGRRFQLDPPPQGHASGERVEVDGDPEPARMSFQMAAPLLRLRGIRRR